MSEAEFSGLEEGKGGRLEGWKVEPLIIRAGIYEIIGWVVSGYNARVLVPHYPCRCLAQFNLFLKIFLLFSGLPKFLFHVL